MWVITFPVTQGISKRLLPLEILKNQSLTFEKHAIGPFGQCLEANKDNVITNIDNLCTFLSIIIGPTGNIQGTQKVFDIRTGVI